MQFTAKNVDEAIELGLKEMNLTKEQVEIEIIEQVQKSLFKKGRATVEITKKITDEEKTLEFVKQILEYMELKAEAELSIENKQTVITLKADDSNAIIGYRGEILDAIQTLSGARLNIGKKDYQKVVVNCENYREKREETLINLAHKLEQKATDMRREVILEPMSPFERRIIHTALSESETVTTKSEGKEPNRYVVIVPNDLDEFSKPYNADRNNRENDKKGGKGRRNGNKNFKNNKRKSSGFTETKKKTSISFGTYLGNSLK